MRLATNKDVLKALGLEHYKNLMSCTITITPESSIPKVDLVVALEKQEKDWLAVINSGKSHSNVLAIVEAAE